MCLFFDTFTFDKVCIIWYEMSDLRPMYLKGSSSSYVLQSRFNISQKN